MADSPILPRVAARERAVVTLAFATLCAASERSPKVAIDTVEVRLALRCLLRHCADRNALEMFWEGACADHPISRSQTCNAALNGIQRQLHQAGFRELDRYRALDSVAAIGEPPPMCNRARRDTEPETLFAHYGARWAEPRPMDNRFDPNELRPKGRAYVVREDLHGRGRGLDIMAWDVLGGQAAWPMTNVRNLALPQWRRLAERPENRCLVPLTEFCEFTPAKHDLGDGKPPLKGEMWFQAADQPLFAVAGFWQPVAGGGKGFTMVTCDANELVAPIHPKAMVTILAPEDQERWLSCPYEEVLTLQRPYPAERMTMRGPVFPTRRSER